MKWHIASAVAVAGLLAGIGLYRAGAMLAEVEPNAEEAQLYQAVQVPQPQAPIAVASSTPQFIVLSFDGSKSVDMLTQTLDFERTMAAEGKPLRFTYFINAAYFLTKDTASVYQGPGQLPGVTSIGFSNSADDIAKRVAAFNTAYAMGNEIGSHTVGHFNGKAWTYDEWKQEFTSFAGLMSAVPQNNPSVAIDQPQFVSAIRGFRAPDLGVNNNLYKVEKDFNFTYDASGVGPGNAWPFKDSNGIWHIPLGGIKLNGDQPGIAMDYSLWMHQSQAKNTAVKGTPLWQSDFAEVTNAYEQYFDTNYNTTRAPVVIGHHFSKWNDGVYWEAMKAFATEECGKPQVRCITFSELVEYLNTHGVPTKK